MQINIRKNETYLAQALRRGAFSDARAENGAEAGRVGLLRGDRVEISSEGSRLEKALRGEQDAKPNYNVPSSMGESRGAAEEDPDEKIREIQKKLRAAMQEQSEAMLELQEAGRAGSQLQSAAMNELEAGQEDGAAEDASGTADQQKAEAQRKLSEALVKILQLQEELKAAMQAKQAQAGAAMGNMAPLPKGTLHDSSV